MTAVSHDGLADALEALLAETPGQFAPALAATLRVPKGTVNPVLYNDSRFIRSDETKPRWYLASQASLADSVATTKSVMKSGNASAPPSTPLASSEALLGADDDTDDPDEIDPAILARFIKTDPAPRRSWSPPEATASNPHALYEWQREALARWRVRGHRGIIDAVTGSGKTRLAVAAIDDHAASGGKTVVLVPTIVLLHQWVDVLQDSLPGLTIGRVGDGYDDRLEHCDVLVSVIASARTRAFLLKGAEGLLVVDECHRSASEKNQDALDDRFAKRLGLSATHERMDGAHETVLLPYFERVVFTIGYARAIDDGVITNVRAAFVGVDFTEEERQLYERYVLELRSLRRTLVRDFGCPKGPFSAFLDAVIRLTSGSGGMKASMTANKWLAKWREKRELLAETIAKQHAVLALVGAIEDAERTLLFTQSITSANSLAENLTAAGVAASPHHSDLSSDEREEIMTAFDTGDLRVLSSVQTLEEGVDVPDADLAVIVASSKQRRQMIQRMGRIMRRKHDARDARFIILFVQDTEEDPRRGAHELFVDELLEVARESNIFRLDQVDELRVFLDPQRR